MNGEQISRALSADRAARRTFLGVFAKDNIPRLPRDPKKYPVSFVVNTDTLREPGEHWTAVYYTSPNVGEFLDSYGRAPHALGFTRKRLSGIKRWNKIKLQSVYSRVCGQYCVAFIALRARARASSAAVFTTSNGFHPNTPERNDAAVVKLLCSVS